MALIDSERRLARQAPNGDTSSTVAPVAHPIVRSVNEASANKAPPVVEPVTEPPYDTVLHVVGRITDAVMSFLGPMTEALLDEGSRQVVVLLDAPEHRHRLSRFDHRVELIAVPLERFGWRHWMGIREAVRRQLGIPSIAAVHFHGLRPWVLGAGAARGSRQPAAVYMSPHGSRLMWALRMFGILSSVTTRKLEASSFIASSRLDAQHLIASGLSPVTLESAIDDAFFLAPRSEAREALVIAGDHKQGRDGVELASRMAVVLGSSEPKLAFEWLGPVGVSSSARLAAANVKSRGHLPEAELIERLAAGWVYLAPGLDPHFPVLLAQAMAGGLPCLVFDTPMNRAMIEHDVSGLVYRSEEEALDMLTRLIDQPTLRRRLGEAARNSAHRRFSVGQFRERMLPIYSPMRSVWRTTLP